MKLFLKIFAIILILAVLFVAGFAVWGDQFERVLSQKECIIWFSQIKPFAWAIGIGLLMVDLLLPIPATGIMAALGSVYGLWLGTIISIVGSGGAGVLAYGVARYAGKNATRFLASNEELEQFQELFNSWGGAAIIVSRMMPILPEVMTILAGIAKMNIGKFLTALFLGTIPTCFLFTYLGDASQSKPLWGMVLAVIMPLAVWPVFLKLVSTNTGKNYKKTNPE